ncbi:glycosyltransferase [Hordeum vulgare]|nr:glycosyltransferase [Hordeum vulgare]
MRAHRIVERVQEEQHCWYGVREPRQVLVVIPTDSRAFQALHLTGLLHSLCNVPYPLTWIVVEAAGVTNATAALFSRSPVLSRVAEHSINIDTGMVALEEGTGVSDQLQKHWTNADMGLAASSGFDAQAVPGSQGHHGRPGQRCTEQGAVAGDAVEEAVAVSNSHRTAARTTERDQAEELAPVGRQRRTAATDSGVVAGAT